MTVKTQQQKNEFLPFSQAILPAVMLGIVGVLLIYFWLNPGSNSDFTERLPKPQDSAKAGAAQEQAGPKFGKLMQFDGKAADLPGAWPGFRGVNLDAICSDGVSLAKSWPQTGPKKLWSVELGEGYAGAAVLAGRVYVMDYDQKNKSDAVRCFSLADGKEIWRYSYPVNVKRNHGMSRTVPAVTEKYLITIGPKCHVCCLDPASGEFRWSLDMVAEFGATVPDWYNGQCPLIDDDKLILAPAGKVLMAAVECSTGKIIWQTPNPDPDNWRLSHSSIVPAKFGDTKMYVYCTSSSVVGVSAKDGTLLWQYNDWGRTLAVVASPLVTGDGLIFLSGGYNSGAKMIRLSRQSDKITVEQVFKLDSTVFGSEQQTPILYKGYIYGLRPDRQFVCLDLAGKIIWSSGDTHRFGSRGLGPYSIADGLIYILDDDGVLTIARAGPDGYNQLAQTRVLDGHEAWAPMAFAAGRLLVRDFNNMACLNIAE
jgi:outer membrane protein assembly factor BamB